MRTMHSVVKRGALYWDRALSPASAYANRIAAIQQCIASHGDAAWLLVGDVIRHGPVVYATNFMPRVRSALVFIPAQGDPTLFANISLRDVPAARLITDIEDIRPFSRLPKDLSSFIAERLPQGGVIGTCGVEDCLPANDWWAIEESLPLVEWAPRDPEINAMRAVKDAFEVAAIQRSMDLANLALDAAPDLLRRGLSMRVVIAELDRMVRSRGAEDVRFLIATGAQARQALRPVDDSAPEDGDTVLIYCAVQNQRYWGEAGQTYAIGNAPQALKELHARALGALAAMAAQIKPGAPASDIADIAANLLANEHQIAATYGLGGGIGLDASEGLSISQQETSTIEANATIALRVMLHGPDGGVAVMRSLHVTEQDAHLFSRRDELIVV